MGGRAGPRRGKEANVEGFPFFFEKEGQRYLKCLFWMWLAQKDSGRILFLVTRLVCMFIRTNACCLYLSCGDLVWCSSGL